MASSTWRVNNSTTLGNYVCGPWVGNRAYALGDRVVCRVAYATTARRAYVYECTTAGTSHATTEPTWPTSGTVNDGAGTLVWTTQSPNDGTWNNASCFLHYIMNHASAAGDTILIDDGHSESTSMGAGAVYNMLGGTINSFKYIYCVNKADDSLSVGAVVNSPAYILQFSNYGYSYGVTYATTNNNISFLTSSVNTEWIMEGGGGAVLNLGGVNVIIIVSAITYTGSLKIINGDVNIANAGGKIQVSYGGLFTWNKGTLTRGGANITLLLANTNDPGSTCISNVDLSAIHTGTLVSLGSASTKYLIVERCKMSASTTFTTSALTKRYPGRIAVHHSNSSGEACGISEFSYCGSVVNEATIVRTSGASDGTNAFSLKMVTLASNTVENIDGLVSPPIYGWTDSTTEKTFTVEGIWDSASNIQDDEIWLEFEYPVDASSGLGGLARDKCAILGTPADQTTSAATWTTTGLANPNEFKLSVTVTPTKAGPITARVHLAKASTTVYIDTMITES